MFHCSICSSTFTTAAKLLTHKRKAKCVYRVAERAYDAAHAQDEATSSAIMEDVEMADVSEQQSSAEEELHGNFISSLKKYLLNSLV